MSLSRTRLDAVDRRLLALLQRDATQTAQALGSALALSASQAGRRRQRLEAAGLIRGYRALLAAGPLGLTVQAFVQVALAAQAPEAAERFHRLVRALDEVTGVWAMTGASDYLLRVHCADLAALNRLVREELLPHQSVARVESQIVMEAIKEDSPLPL